MLPGAARPARPAGPHAVDEPGHLDRGRGGLLAAVAHLAARAVPRLLLAERGDHAERRRHAGRERDLADAGGGLARDVLEVRRLPADHDAEAHDARVPARPGPVGRGLGQLEGARHPVALDAPRGPPRRPERPERAVHEPLGDPLVEPGRDDGETQRPLGAARRPGSRRAPGHLSRAATTAGARACRAWSTGTSGWTRWP